MKKFLGLKVCSNLLLLRCNDHCSCLRSFPLIICILLIYCSGCRWWCIHGIICWRNLSGYRYQGFFFLLIDLNIAVEVDEAHFLNLLVDIVLETKTGVGVVLHKCHGRWFWGPYHQHTSWIPWHRYGSKSTPVPNTRDIQTLVVYKDICLGHLKYFICSLTAIFWNVDDMLSFGISFQQPSKSVRFERRALFYFSLKTLPQLLLPLHSCWSCQRGLPGTKVVVEERASELPHMT